jgi:hypothetical protein
MNKQLVPVIVEDFKKGIYFYMAPEDQIKEELDKIPEDWMCAGRINQGSWLGFDLYKYYYVKESDGEKYKLTEKHETIYVEEEV